jgi:hypothetical protein
MIRVFFLLLSFSLFFVSFSANTVAEQIEAEASSGLPFDISEKDNNVALLFTMTDEGGRLRNIELMRSVFNDGTLGFSCEYYHNKKLPEIYGKIKETASRINEYGTLLLYLNSHGGGSGANFGMTASGGWFKFSKVLENISSVKKLKRLIVLVDTCHAEGAINEGFQGGGTLIKNIKTSMIELPNYYGGRKRPSFMSFFENSPNNFYYGENSGAYEEALIITSSSSADLSMRGTFALNFKKAFEKTKSYEDPKVSDFLKIFAEAHSTSGQQPYFKSIPDSILSEPLFKTFAARSLPILDKSGKSFKKDYILIPN